MLKKLNLQKLNLKNNWGVIAPLGVIIIIIIINLFAFNHLPDDPAEQVKQLQESNLEMRAEKIIKAELEKDATDIQWHYLYVDNHFNITPTKDNKRNDTEIEAYYQTLAQNNATADMGYFGLGFICIKQKSYTEAIDYFKKINNKNIKYINGLMGYAYWFKWETNLAEVHFKREIALDGNKTDAVAYLSILYVQLDRFEEVDKLLQNKNLAHYVPIYTQRKVAFEREDWNQYTYLMILAPLDELKGEAILGALIIWLMWLIFFWRIDIFEQEPAVFLLGAFILGATFAFATTLLSDNLQAIKPLGLGGGWFKDLIFAVVYIGAIEELVKFIPVLLLIVFSRQVNEPIDLLIYGSLSALGFATLENAMYFSNYGLNIVFGRFLISTTGHIIWTSTICYAWARAKYITPTRSWFIVLVGYGLAVLGHGLFDFFLLSLEGNLALLSYLLILISVGVFNKMLRTALNFSPYFDHKLLQSDRLENQAVLITGGSILLLMVFVHDHLKYATFIANFNIFTSIMFQLQLIFIILGAFSEFTLSHKTQLPLFYSKDK